MRHAGGVLREDPLVMRRTISSAAAAVAMVAGVAWSGTAMAQEDAPPAKDADDTPASVADLAWMTGTWSGPVGGGNVLEENWTVPRAGSIQSLVRQTGPNGTGMVELIVIEEEEGTLRLRLQQWNPGMKPRTAGPAVMKLAEMGENTVAFEAEADSAFDMLRYTRDGDNFTISITFPGGRSIDLPLKAGS